MNTAPVVSLLGKLQKYMEAESNLSLHSVFGSPDNMQSCRGGELTNKGPRITFDRLFELSNRWWVTAKIQVTFDCTLKNGKLASRKPLTVRMWAEASLNKLQEIKDLAEEVLQAQKDDSKYKIECNNSRLVITFMDKSVALKKNGLELTSDEIHPEIIIAGLAKLAGNTTLSTCSYMVDWPQGNKGVVYEDEFQKELNTYNSIFEKATLLTELLLDGYSYAKSRPTVVRNENERDYTLSTVICSIRRPSEFSSLKSVTGQCPFRSVKPEYTPYPYKVQSLNINEEDVRIQTKALSLVGRDICNSCSNQLGCLASNYESVPWSMSLALSVV